MGMGTLMVEARSADEALPIDGATIIIRNQDEQKEITTDGNGQSAVFQIEAPDRERTLSPDIPTPHYSTVEVLVSKPGFVTNIIKNVPIFDGVDAYLPVHMLPEADGYPKTETYDIPKPAVEEGGPRMMMAPSEPNVPAMAADPPDPPQSRALNEVFIPDYITVHLGKPNDYARNLRVPFAEYIKNVTASEIYPTWPRNSILANIHAIVSFTLNRIYTEWYRSRGFPFDITNSTINPQRLYAL